MILPKKHINSLKTLDNKSKLELAEIFKTVITLYDKLFNAIMPLSFGLHYAPEINSESNYWHMHFHFNPLLLRSSSVRKFMAGYEMFAAPQRDITPEDAADSLKRVLDRMK